MILYIVATTVLVALCVGGGWGDGGDDSAGVGRW